MGSDKLKRKLILLSLVFGLSPLGITCSFGQHPSLADKITFVNCDESCWMRYAAFTQARQFGVPEKRLLKIWPGITKQPLPNTVKDALDRSIDASNLWIGCLSDERPTQIHRLDMLGNRAKEDDDPVLVKDAASAVLAALIPIGDFVLDPDQNALPQFVAHSIAWKKTAVNLKGTERMELWYRRASESQRLRFLNLALQSQWQPAFPTIEEAFLKRVKQPDSFLELEVAAYCRHRRQHARSFAEEYYKLHAGTNESFEHFRQGNRILVGSTLSEGIGMYLKSGDQGFGGLLRYSVDRPWAYHSMQIEPVSMSQPILERQLHLLVAGAKRADDLEKRLLLIGAASGVVDTLQEVLSRASRLDSTPLGGPVNDRWAGLVGDLQILIQDHGNTKKHRHVVNTPAIQASSLIWEMWGPGTRHMDVLFGKQDYDWRRDAMDLFGGTTNVSLLEAASDILKGELKNAGKRDVDTGRKLTQKFGDETAGSWRSLTEQLGWEERLQLACEVRQNTEFAKRMATRNSIWLDLECHPSVPRSLHRLWNEEIANNALDATTGSFLEDWIASESRAGRYWHLVAVSSSDAPGLSAYVFPASFKLMPITIRDSKSSGPYLSVTIEAGFSTLEHLKRVQLTGLKLIPNQLRDQTLAEVYQAFAENDQDTGDRARAIKVSMVAYPKRDNSH